jgi:polypeptide N-acetylgalactosaminyltransferase
MLKNLSFPVFQIQYLDIASGWLEPLLDRIADSQSNVVAPLIDNMSFDTLEYQYFSGRKAPVGGFGWNLIFSWHPIPERDQKRRKSAVDPVRY